MGDRISRLAVDLGEWFETNRDSVPRYIEKYFKGLGERPRPFDGRYFETFAAMGSPDRFVATDILAIGALSVTLQAGSALELLEINADKFNRALRDLPDCEFWQAQRDVFDTDGPAMKLFRLLDELPGVGTTKATKLMAVKRPHLVPVQDKLIEAELIEPGGKFWLPLHDQLSNQGLREFIAELTAGAPDGTSLLRRIDVSVWMHVRDRKKAARAGKRNRNSN